MSNEKPDVCLSEQSKTRKTHRSEIKREKQRNNVLAGKKEKQKEK